MSVATFAGEIGIGYNWLDKEDFLPKYRNPSAFSLRMVQLGLMYSFDQTPRLQYLDHKWAPHDSFPFSSKESTTADNALVGTKKFPEGLQEQCNLVFLSKSRKERERSRGT
jgi:hypothetical protein